MNNSFNITKNRWQKVYWFARMLINTDKYGGIGKENKLLTTIASSLRLLQEENIKKDPKYILSLQKKALKNILHERFKNAKTKKKRIEKLITDLDSEISDLKDMEVFILTCENVMLPINQALENIPNDDKEFTLSIAKSFLDVQHEKGLATVIKLWDDLGVKGSLTAERVEIIKAFATLRVLLSQKNDLSQLDKDVILSAFVQEFERRAAQKRKSRAGSSLEDATSFILEYFNIPMYHEPEHFRTDIEVDKWIKTKDGWLIGISCKRTIRERWKQVSSAESQILSNYKIKQLYHIFVYDEDLSDEKLVQLGGQRHVFYLPDESRILDYAKSHLGLKEYVRPMSQLIKDLRKQL